MTRRATPSIYETVRQPRAAAVLIPLTSSRRNQSGEAARLLDLPADPEASTALGARASGPRAGYSAPSANSPIRSE